MLEIVRYCPNCKDVWFSESMTHCPSCGDELDYAFDHGWICTECGEDVEDDWRYCGYCGASVSEYRVSI